jgi:hypothetical protein
MRNNIVCIITKLISVDCIEPFYLLPKEKGMEAYRGRGSIFSQILKLTVKGTHRQYAVASESNGNRSLMDEVI